MRNPKILVLDRDPELREQVADVVDDVRPRPEVLTCQWVDDLDDVLTEQGPVDVLVAGPSMGDRNGLAQLRLVHDELPAVPMVLAFDRRPRAQLRDLLQVGAIDLLRLPVHDKKLLESLERALELARKLEPPAPVITAAAPVLASPMGTVARSPGRVFTVASATGGCGKTFMATNLAYYLAHHSGKRVCVIDLDLQFGEVSTALRLKPRFTIYDALHREDSEEGDLAEHIEEYLVTHETGVSVLAAPRDPSEADGISSPDVTRIIEAARQHFDFVVVDTPSALTEIVLAAFEGAERLFVMATLDLPSVRNLGVFLTTLEKLRVPTDNVRLILNKAESDVGIEVSQVEKLFAQGFEAVLPYAKEVSRSINLGMPVMAAAPNSEVSRNMAPMMSALLPDGHLARMAPSAEVAGEGFLGRLFHRSQPHAS